MAESARPTGRTGWGANPASGTSGTPDAARSGPPIQWGQPYLTDGRIPVMAIRPHSPLVIVDDEPEVAASTAELLNVCGFRDRGAVS